MLAEGNALSRCFEAATAEAAETAETARATPPSSSDSARGGATSGVLSTAAWERCIASVCGFRGCIMGEGVYAPQLAAWQRAARNFHWVLLPGESLRNRPAEALGRIFAALKLPQPPDVTVAGIRPFGRSLEPGRRWRAACTLPALDPVCASSDAAACASRGRSHASRHSCPSGSSRVTRPAALPTADCPRRPPPSPPAASSMPSTPATTRRYATSSPSWMPSACHSGRTSPGSLPPQPTVRGAVKDCARCTVRPPRCTRCSAREGLLPPRAPWLAHRAGSALGRARLSSCSARETRNRRRN